MFNLVQELPHLREQTRKPIQVERLDWQQEFNQQSEWGSDQIELGLVRQHLKDLSQDSPK